MDARTTPLPRGTITYVIAQPRSLPAWIELIILEPMRLRARFALCASFYEVVLGRRGQRQVHSSSAALRLPSPQDYWSTLSAQPRSAVAWRPSATAVTLYFSSRSTTRSCAAGSAPCLSMSTNESQHSLPSGNKHCAEPD